jgi:hypothetical protein
MVHGLAERKQILRGRQHALKLGRGRRCIARRELDACGKTDTLLHGRNRKAVVHIKHRTGETCSAARAEMAVIATLDGERQIDAERAKYVGRPRPERHNGRVGVDRPLHSLDPPLPVRTVQAPGIAREQ